MKQLKQLKQMSARRIQSNRLFYMTIRHAAHNPLIPLVKIIPKEAQKSLVN